MRWIVGVVVISLLWSTAAMRAQDGAASAVERLNAFGPEASELAKRSGTWRCIATMWPVPGAVPVVTKGLTAQRTMIGSYLQEVLQPTAGETAGFSVGTY